MSGECSKTWSFPDIRFLSGIVPESFFVRNLSWPDFVKLKDGYDLMMIISYTIIMLLSLKFIIIDSIFACSANLLSMSRRVLNVNFALLMFFIKINLSFFRKCIRNLSRIFCIKIYPDIFRIQILIVRSLSSCLKYFRTFSVFRFFVRTNSGHNKIPDSNFYHFLGQKAGIFRTHPTISGHFR